MAIATLAAVHKFVFAYLHIRLKFPRTSRLQRRFLESLEMRDQLWRARKANWLASRVELVHPEWQAYAASVEASFPPLSK
jgi:hypothetical protein